MKLLNKNEALCALGALACCLVLLAPGKAIAEESPDSNDDSVASLSLVSASNQGTGAATGLEVAAGDDVSDAMKTAEVSDVTVEFVAIEASSGTSERNEQLAQQATEAKDAGATVVLKHKADAGTASAEANNFVGVAATVPNSAYALDLVGAPTTSRNPSWATSWLDLVYSRTGVRALIRADLAAARMAGWEAAAQSGYGLWLVGEGSVADTAWGTADVSQTQDATAGAPAVVSWSPSAKSPGARAASDPTSERAWAPVYDYTYYSAHNVDLRKVFGSNRSAYLNHFITFGMREGRRASEGFDPLSYRFEHSDLRAAFRSDWKSYYVHYLNFGRSERRVAKNVTALKDPASTWAGVDYAPVYSFAYYKSHYADLERAFGDYDDYGYLAHFVTFGMREGRKASDSFDPMSYRLKYPDLRAAFRSDWKAYYTHYLSYGRREGRKATGTASLVSPASKLGGVDYSPVYDFAYYKSHYADLRRAFSDIDDYGYLTHFINFGMSEARRASESFDPASYRFEYGDLRRAYGNAWKSYYLHYLSFGRKENRVTTGVTTLKDPISTWGGRDYSTVYDFKTYHDRYADLRSAFGEFDDDAYVRHFANFGLLEGRVAKDGYNASNYQELRETAVVLQSARTTPSPGPGLCSEWISQLFNKVGFPYDWGDADDLYWAYCHNANYNELKAGMILAVPSHTHTRMGRIYGHICIYVGDGTIMDNVGYIRTASLDWWLSYYRTTYTPQFGWYENRAF